MEVTNRDGLGILYAPPPANEELNSRNINRIGETYWIKSATKRKPGHRTWEVGLSITYPLNHSDVGVSGGDPVDGFFYRIDYDLTGVASRQEWYEVTEVFPADNPLDIQDFMRWRNGIPPRQEEFDPDEFLDGIDHGLPSPDEQRAFADEVLLKAERKLRRKPYRTTKESFGYGTLVVGLPLWFAAMPLHPFRKQNADVDFACRTAEGLDRLRLEYLADDTNPFGRVVVLWESTSAAIAEWLKGVDRNAYAAVEARTRQVIPTCLLPDVLVRHKLKLGLSWRLETHNDDKHGRFPTPLPPIVRALESVIHAGG